MLSAYVCRLSSSSNSALRVITAWYSVTYFSPVIGVLNSSLLRAFTVFSVAIVNSVTRLRHCSMLSCSVDVMISVKNNR